MYTSPSISLGRESDVMCAMWPFTRKMLEAGRFGAAKGRILPFFVMLPQPMPPRASVQRVLRARNPTHRERLHGTGTCALSPSARTVHAVSYQYVLFVSRQMGAATQWPALARRSKRLRLLLVRRSLALVL